MFLNNHFSRRSDIVLLYYYNQFIQNERITVDHCFLENTLCLFIAEVILTQSDCFSITDR